MLSLVSFIGNTTSTDEVSVENVLAYENRLYKAMKESDIYMLDLLLHDDLLFIIPTGEVITKEQDLKNYKDRIIEIEELIPETESLNIIEDTAVITLTIALKGKFRGDSFETRYRYIRFWKNIENELKVIGGSCIPSIALTE
ncbi:nuclear transport factor 2 family protein [Elizabethkingia sp. HX QKY]|uniref:nuclear transport factor 2 family protein n=1 Tax=Elizabethkingia TaxID=308865 RepID=UPI002A24321B|nr:nuclear transport factor 2 family protein [Elizabethkingia sp. HX QKY]MDX8570322.1 nuclear transport factor 2 family protein [Elizabethkingia sp. HX QKY]